MHSNLNRLPLAVALGLVLSSPALAQAVYSSTTATGQQAPTTTNTGNSTGTNLDANANIGQTTTMPGASVNTTGQLGANVSSGTVNPNTADSTRPDPNVTDSSMGTPTERQPVTRPTLDQSDVAPDDYYTGTHSTLGNATGIAPTTGSEEGSSGVRSTTNGRTSTSTGTGNGGGTPSSGSSSSGSSGSSR